VCPIGSEDKERLMATTRGRWTGGQVLGAFEEHLRRSRGLCAGTRRNYGRYAHAFLQAVFVGGPVDVAAIGVGDVVGFVAGLSGRYQPRTVELAASALRSFFRFLRAEGLRADRLEDAVPMVNRPGFGAASCLAKDAGHGEEVPEGAAGACDPDGGGSTR
jgi:hypothetical protein